MNKFKLWYLRLRKWWITKVIYWAYRDLPFEISYTAIAEKYEYPDLGKILAEFDIPEKARHYVIYSPSNTL